MSDDIELTSSIVVFFAGSGKPNQLRGSGNEVAPAVAVDTPRAVRALSMAEGDGALKHVARIVRGLRQVQQGCIALIQSFALWPTRMR